MAYSTKILIAVLLLLSPLHGFAAGSQDSLIKIEPIVGYETIYRDYPTPHTSTRTTYGGRLAIGPNWLAAELEYLNGSDTKTYAVAPQTVKNEDQKLKLGLRSTYNMGSYFFLTGRLGGQATENKRTETADGVATETKKTTTHPYAGASLGVRLGSTLNVSAGTTVVFRDSKDMKKNDVQNTFSLSVGLNKSF